MKKNNQSRVSKFTQFFYRRSTIAIFLGLVCLIGLPLRTQNIKLDGYISDDAWWHYRQVNQVIESGHRLNPDIYEFTTLSRPMTYPPLFHYMVASAYKIFRRFLPLTIFTHYFNLLEAVFYILLIYWLSYLISQDKLFSIIGALAGSLSYGIIIRARAGELMPFVPGDLFSLAAISLLFMLLTDITGKKGFYLCVISGTLFALAMLSWSGTALIYLPLILFMSLSIIIYSPGLVKNAFKFFLTCSIPVLIMSLPWYYPIFAKYGLNPHHPEMDWFMKNFTVLHQRKALPFYIFTSGIAIFSIPIAFLVCIFKRNPKNLLFLFWIILGAVATYTGWRGYVAVVPIISAIAMSIAVSAIVRFLFGKDSKYLPVVFIVIFLIVGVIGYNISSQRLSPLDPDSISEVRTNARSIKMLKYLKDNYPQAVTIDHITWVSEDAGAGSLRMVGGQYLEYLPSGSAEVLKDISRFYLSDEDKAFEICKKYDVELVILRKQLLRIPQLSILFAPPELDSEDYLSPSKESRQSKELTINFTEEGVKSMLFQMLNRQDLKHFELVYADEVEDDSIPFLVVYKVRNDSFSDSE
ncbi:MAG: hypothetical protein ABIH19_03710 [Candidatus Omnitrophota bacterium]